MKGAAPHGGERHIDGDELLYLMAEIISDALGTHVRFQQTTFDAYKDRFVSFGMSEAMAQGMTDMAAAKNQGIDNVVQRTPHNTTPTTFRQWCEAVLRPAVLDQTGP
jgi:2-phosphoglycerate kinase